ncbi:hypothetical protein BGZ83_011050, partial [Gryganskiella cystojenkinii]
MKISVILLLSAAAAVAYAHSPSPSNPQKQTPHQQQHYKNGAMAQREGLYARNRFASTIAQHSSEEAAIMEKREFPLVGNLDGLPILNGLANGL